MQLNQLVIPIRLSSAFNTGFRLVYPRVKGRGHSGFTYHSDFFGVLANNSKPCSFGLEKIKGLCQCGIMLYVMGLLVFEVFVADRLKYFVSLPLSQEANFYEFIDFNKAYNQWHVFGHLVRSPVLRLFEPTHHQPRALQFFLNKFICKLSVYDLSVLNIQYLCHRHYEVFN